MGKISKAEKKLKPEIIIPSKIEVQAIGRCSADGDIDAVEVARRLACAAEPGALAEPGHDGRKPELINVKNVRSVDGGKITAKRNANHCTICWLLHRKHLTELQHRAAERLQDDHSLAGLTSIPSALAALASHGSGSGSVADLADSKIDAANRRSAALMSAGTSGRFLLEQMVLADRTAGEIAKLLRIDKQGVVPALRVALDGLVVHYKLEITGNAAPAVRTYHPFQDDRAEK